MNVLRVRRSWLIKTSLFPLSGREYHDYVLAMAFDTPPPELPDFTGIEHTVVFTTVLGRGSIE